MKTAQAHKHSSVKRTDLHITMQRIAIAASEGRVDDVNRLSCECLLLTAQWCSDTRAQAIANRSAAEA